MAGISFSPHEAFSSISSIAFMMSAGVKVKSISGSENWGWSLGALALGSLGSLKTEVNWDWRRSAMLLELVWKTPCLSIRGPTEDLTLDFCLAYEKKQRGLSLIESKTFDSLNCCWANMESLIWSWMTARSSRSFSISSWM